MLGDADQRLEPAAETLKERCGGTVALGCKSASVPLTLPSADAW